MLQHDNPFWRFSLNLYQVRRIREALHQLQDEAGANMNLLLFALWVAQQQLRFLPNRTVHFEQLENWHRDYTLPLRHQRVTLKRLAEKADKNDQGPLHQMRKHIQQAEGYAEQQEQAVLYYYYQQRQGLTPCEDRKAALIENLTDCFDVSSQVERTPLEVLLGILLDKEQIESTVVKLIERLERRGVRFSELSRLNSP